MSNDYLLDCFKEVTGNKDLTARPTKKDIPSDNKPKNHRGIIQTFINDLPALAPALAMLGWTRGEINRLQNDLEIRLDAEATK